MKTFALISCLFFTWYVTFSQSLNVEVSTDSLLFGNPLKVIFHVEGASADGLETPDFEGFTILSGPSYSSSISIVNGTMSQQASITYWLEPSEIGTWYIPPAFLETDSGAVLESEPVEILVVPNPDGIRQMPDERANDWFQGGFHFDFGDFLNPFPNTPARPEPKKKERERKVYKF
jgi:hypothetical protein